jgi:MYXO-CTERM domain-containing protein
MRLSSLGAAGLLSVCLVSGSALANKNGIITRSGKTSGSSCAGSSCHSAPANTPRPTVTLTGPTTLNSGETGNYTLVIAGGPAAVGGMNVAVDSAQASLQAGTGQRKQLAEITHSVPKAFANNEVRFDFTMIAPASGGSVRIFGAGNSTNNDGTNSGDTSAAATLDVTIVGPSGTDGGTQPDGGTDPEEEMPGCGCSAGSSAPLFPLLALLAAGVRRRRRS